MSQEASHVSRALSIQSAALRTMPKAAAMWAVPVEAPPVEKPVLPGIPCAECICCGLRSSYDVNPRG